MAKKGRPPKFVLDPNGRAISGLSYNKSSNCYYATYSKPRVWFSRDFKTSLIEFQKYNSNKSKEQPTVEIQVPFKSPIVHTNGQIDWSDIPDDPPVISAAYEGESTDIPEILFLEKARELILKDPISAAIKLGIPEISRLEDLPKLEKPLLVKDIGQFYIDRRKPSKDEKRKVESVWKEFCQIIPCKTIREITSNMIYDYYDKISRQYKENNFASSWLKSRFARIKTVLNYSKKYGRTNKRELSRVLEWCQCLSVPSDTAVNPNPISKEDVHQLLKIANVKWRAMILLSLNCGYYAKDIHDLKKDMIKSKDNLYYIVFPREKNKL
jgi:hypothetical protein